MGIQREEYPCPKCRDTSKRLCVTRIGRRLLIHDRSAAVAGPTRRGSCSKGREAMSVRSKQYDKKRREVDVGESAKASGIATKETVLRVHFVPSLGAKRLDAITNDVVQSVKRSLREKSAKTVNN